MPKPIAPQINWNNPITKGLVADIPIFERGGATTKDVAGKYTGTITSAVWNRNLLGPWLTFSSGTRVQISGSAILAGTRSYSIRAIIRPSTSAQSTSGGAIYVERNGSAGNDILKFNYSDNSNIGTLRFQYRDDAATLNAILSTTLISDTFIHDCVVTKNGTTITFYIDGKNAGGGTLTATDTQTDSVVAQYGNDPRDGNSSFLGDINNLQLWKRVLTPKEVLTLYLNPWITYRTTLPMPLNSGIYI